MRIYDHENQYHNEDYIHQTDNQLKIVFNENAISAQGAIDEVGQGIAQNNKSYNYSDIEIQKMRLMQELEQNSLKKESQQNSNQIGNDTSQHSVIHTNTPQREPRKGWQNPQVFGQYLPSPSPLKLEDQRKMQSQSVPQSAQVPKGKSKQHKRQKTSYYDDKRPNYAVTQLLKPEPSSES